jgi:hypothetical protein
MRQRRVSACAAALLLLNLQAGCSTYRPVLLSNVAPGEAIRVHFPSTAPVFAARHETGSVSPIEVLAVRVIRGKFISAADDSVRLGAVVRLSSPHVRYGESYRFASFERVDAWDPVEVRRFSAERTGLVIGGAALAVYLVRAALLSISFPVKGMTGVGY